MSLLNLTANLLLGTKPCKMMPLQQLGLLKKFEKLRLRTMIHKNESHQWQIVTRKRGKKLENTKPSTAEQQSCAQRLLHDEIEEQTSGNFKSSTLTMERPVQQSDMDNSIEAAIKRLSNLPRLLDIKK
ncbi:hypothetical protein SLE2022_360750 [Rubroshorea leprosula]